MLCVVVVSVAIVSVQYHHNSRTYGRLMNSVVIRLGFPRKPTQQSTECRVSMEHLPPVHGQSVTFPWNVCEESLECLFVRRFQTEFFVLTTDSMKSIHLSTCIPFTHTVHTYFPQQTTCS